jgi:cytochrome P450
MVALHPDVQDRLVEEMVSVGVPVGDTPEAIARVLLNSDSIKRLLYLQAVLNESMRLHPAGAPASNRCAQQHWGGRIGAAMCSTTPSTVPNPPTPVYSIHI